MKDMRTIRDALPHAMIFDHFHGMPSIVETRWLCLWEFTAYIAQHFSEVSDALAGKEHALSVLHRYRFSDLRDCLTAMNSFVKWTEGDGTGLCSACERILRTTAKFQKLAVQDNGYASDFETAFTNRMWTTADLRQILLGFLITKQGLLWFQSLPLWSGNDSGPFPGSRRSVVDLTKSVRNQFETIIGADPQMFAWTWNDYLHHAVFREDDSVLSFWRREQSRTSSFGWGGHGVRVNYLPLSTMAEMLLTLPCSEAAVERVFSHFKIITGDHRHSLGDDILEALLTIRLHGSTNAVEKSTRLAKICAELTPREPLGPPIGRGARDIPVPPSQRASVEPPQPFTPISSVYPVPVTNEEEFPEMVRLPRGPRIARGSEDGVESRIQAELPAGVPGVHASSQPPPMSTGGSWCPASSQPPPMSTGEVEEILSLDERRQSPHAHEDAGSQCEATFDRALALSLSLPATEIEEPCDRFPWKDTESAREQDGVGLEGV
jgi:hypothetical protein